MTRLLAQRLAGSPDLYRGSARAPWHSINFVTSHDGFTLADLVSYNDKHNWENGEGNVDGHDDNLSWNCGAEGPSTDPEVLALRRRQQRNFLALLLVSQGVPMLLGGDELGRTQRGNNNAYCQDNETSWVDWTLLEKNAELARFVGAPGPLPQGPSVAAAAHVLRGRGGPAARLARCEARQARLGRDLARARDAPHRGGRRRSDLRVRERALAAQRRSSCRGCGPGKAWRRFLDTSLPPGKDALEPGSRRRSARRTYPAGPRSVVILVGR